MVMILRWNADRDSQPSEGDVWVSPFCNTVQSRPKFIPVPLSSLQQTELKYPRR